MASCRICACLLFGFTKCAEAYAPSNLTTAKELMGELPMGFSAEKLEEMALYVVDIAPDFIYAGGSKECGGEKCVIGDLGGADYQARAQGILPQLQSLVKLAHELGITVVYSTDAHQSDDIELKIKWPPHSMAGTPQAKVLDIIAPKEGIDIVHGKRTYSSFASPDAAQFEADLKKKKVRTVYMTGLHTNCCCRHSTADLFQRGYEVFWVMDAMEAITPEMHEEGLQYFATWYASRPDLQLLTTEQVLTKWKSLGKDKKTEL